MSRHRRRSKSGSSSSDSRYRRRRGRRRYYRRRSDSHSTSASTASTVSSKKSQNTAWENIVIHYLSKLKNYWTSGYSAKPKPGSDQKKKGVTEDKNKMEVLDLNAFDKQDYCLAGKRKALNIVSNALEYGLANGIVSQNGNYFWIRDKLIPKFKISNPRMPMAKSNSYFNCNRCNSLSNNEIPSAECKCVQPTQMESLKSVSKVKVPTRRKPPPGCIRKRRVISCNVNKRKAPRGCSGFLKKCNCTKCKSILKFL